MKPYGNEHTHRIDALDATRTGAKPGRRKTNSRRLHKKTRRAQDKQALRREFGSPGGA